MKKRLVYYFISIILLSCSQPGNDSFTDFASVIKLTHQLIEVNGMADPNRVIVLKDEVIILDGKSDFAFHVINLEGNTFAGSFVKKGHGPAEEMIIQTMTRLTENTFFYKTLSHVKIIEYNSANSEFVFKKSIPVLVNDLIEAFILNNQVYGWNREPREKEFVEYQGDEDMLDFGAGFPLQERYFSAQEQMQLFSAKQITVKPDGTLFATTYNYFPILRIFNSDDGNLKKEVWFENRKPFPDYLITGNDSDWEHVTQNYWFTKSSNNYIYALYTGKTFGEMGYNRNRPGGAVTNLSNEIHVFDWKGNPVRRIITDKEIFDFDVSSDDLVLIAISKEDPDHIYHYDLQ